MKSLIWLGILFMCITLLCGCVYNSLNEAIVKAGDVKGLVSGVPAELKDGDVLLRRKMHVCIPHCKEHRSKK